MSGYGWLTQSALMPKKSKQIKVDDQSSLFGLKAILLRQKEKIAGGETKRVYEMKRTVPNRNAGVQERSKRDEVEKIYPKLHDGARMLQIKQKMYDSLEISKQNVGKLLVDFSAKTLNSQNNSEYEKVRDDFYSGKLEQVQRQREQLGKDSIEDRDVRERLAWEREVLGKLKGEVDEREKVQQVFDKRMHGEEKTALQAVLREFTEQEKRLEEVKQRREQLQSQRIRKLKKLNILAESNAGGLKEKQEQNCQSQLIKMKQKEL